MHKRLALLQKIYRSVRGDSLCPQCGSRMDEWDTRYTCRDLHHVGCTFRIPKGDLDKIARVVIPEWGAEAVAEYNRWVEADRPSLTPFQNQALIRAARNNERLR